MQSAGRKPPARSAAFFKISAGFAFARIRLDSGLRRNDGVKMAAVCAETLPLAQITFE
jgi:hypothetical protein